MSTARDVCHDVIRLLKTKGDVTIVNDRVDEDSVVEHAVDMDVVLDGIVYNISTTVTLIGPEE